MNSIHIVEEKDEEVQKAEEKLSPYGIEHLTPEEAVGRVVESELPGTMGREFYQIVDVDLEEKLTIIENIFTGQQVGIGDDPFPPDYNHFREPQPGAEKARYWMEHQKGDGEWVRTTPLRDSKRVAQLHYGHYKGHENRRLVSRTYKHLPPDVVELDILYIDDELRVYYSEDITGLDEVFGQIKEPDKNYKTVGQIYIDGDNTVVHFDIDEQYKSVGFGNVVKTIKRIRESQA